MSLHTMLSRICKRSPEGMAAISAASAIVNAICRNMPSLQALSKQDALGSLRAWLRIGHGLASGLGRLHELKIWHMDIKPENILCTSKPPARHKLEREAKAIRKWAASAKIADFGLSYFQTGEVESCDAGPDIK